MIRVIVTINAAVYLLGLQLLHGTCLLALRFLDLQDNAISSVAPGSFNGLGSVLYMDLQYNRLSTWAPGTFSGLGSLTWVPVLGTAGGN
jgi:hypothetical protein